MGPLACKQTLPLPTMLPCVGVIPGIHTFVRGGGVSVLYAPTRLLEERINELALEMYPCTVLNDDFYCY